MQLAEWPHKAAFLCILHLACTFIPSGNYYECKLATWCEMDTEFLEVELHSHTIKAAAWLKHCNVFFYFFVS